MRRTYLGALDICINLVLSVCGQFATHTQAGTKLEQSAGEEQIITEDKNTEPATDTSAEE